MKLTNDEKEYLFSKLEYSKKKKSIDSKDNLYNLLKGDKVNFTKEEVELIFKSLEINFRKKLSGDGSVVSNKAFDSIKSKLEKENIILLKYSRIDRKPTKSSSKSEVEDYLKRKKIEYNPTDSKQNLLSLIKEGINILSFDEFSNQ